MIGESREHLSQLVHRLLAAERRQEDCERALENATKEVKVLSEELIPQALEELDLSSYTTSDGLEVALKNQVYASIPPETRDQAYEWLEAAGHGSLIKRTVGVRFGRGEERLAKELLEQIPPRFFDRVEQVVKVEPATLSALVRELLQEGEEVSDSIKVSSVRSVKVRQKTLA